MTTKCVVCLAEVSEAKVFDNPEYHYDGLCPECFELANANKFDKLKEKYIPRTRVVNLKYESYDVFIGRPGKWGNPFKLNVDGNRDEVIAKYEGWLRSKPDLIKEAMTELRNKRLGCYCKPRPCHGDVIVKIIEEEVAKEQQVS